MRNPLVAARMTLARTSALKQAGITVAKTETEIARLAYVDIGQLFDGEGCFKALEDIPEDARRAIVAIEVEELFDYSEEEDDFARLESVEILVAQLLGAVKSIKKEGGLPAALTLPIDSLERWAKPRSEKNRRKHYIGRVKKIKLADKKGALELAGKRDKLFTDRVEHGLSATLEDILAKSYQVTP